MSSREVLQKQNDVVIPKSSKLKIATAPFLLRNDNKKYFFSDPILQNQFYQLNPNQSRKNNCKIIWTDRHIYMIIIIHTG